MPLLIASNKIAKPNGKFTSCVFSFSASRLHFIKKEIMLMLITLFIRAVASNSSDLFLVWSNPRLIVVASISSTAAARCFDY